MNHCNPILREIDHRDDLGAFMNRHGLLGEAAEIGTFAGAYSRQILSTWQGRKLWSIDPYRKFTKTEYFDSTQDCDQEQVYREAQNALRQFGDRSEVIRATSLEAVGRFADGSLDLAYLDGNHSFLATTADIAAWWPKVRSGGVFAGHDCGTRQRDTDTDVLNAVFDFAESINTRFHETWCTSWYFIKP